MCGIYLAISFLCAYLLEIIFASIVHVTSLESLEGHDCHIGLDLV